MASLAYTVGHHQKIVCSKVDGEDQNLRLSFDLHIEHAYETTKAIKFKIC